MSITFMTNFAIYKIKYFIDEYVVQGARKHLFDFIDKAFVNHLGEQ